MGLLSWSTGPSSLSKNTSNSIALAKFDVQIEIQNKYGQLWNEQEQEHVLNWNQHNVMTNLLLVNDNNLTSATQKYNEDADTSGSITNFIKTRSCDWCTRFPSGV